MGCYMSTPDDKVYITEGKGKNFVYATASCQGWRREQEDAEACIPDFDEDASLYILCDGHGGAEVAKYTVEHLPNFLKSHPLYKEGKYQEALEKAFIDFDALLRTDEVMAELTKIAFDEQEKSKSDAETKDDNDSMDFKEESQVDTSAGSSNNNEASGSSSAGPAASSSTAGPSTSNGASTIADDVDTETLRREAEVPIDELVNKYAEHIGAKGRIHSLRQASLKLGGSPVIKSKDDQEADSKDEVETKDHEASSSTGNIGRAEPSSSKSADEGPSSTSGSIQAPKSSLDIFKKAMDQYFDEEDDNSEDDSEFEGTEESDSDEEEDDDDDDDDDDEDDDDDDDDGDDERDEELLSEKSKNKKLLQKKQRRLAGNRGDSSSEDDDSDDYEDSDDEDGDEEENEGGDDDEEEEEDDGGVIDSRLLIARKLNQNLKAATKVHKPVLDSGCTVVVALAKGNKLYVGSAGDSRCIMIMRDGQCKPMSFDHKPEDPIEHRRIQKAGGHVVEGRVNGGLNLSRALGDFTYKNPELDAKDQMITPCPDVRTAELDPDQVEYIFLACDGIWNSMRNQQVTKLIRKIAPTVDYDLVEICMAVFRHCLAPGTDGDGTGCDNMTCILARYDSSIQRDSSTTNHSDLKTLPTNNENNSEHINTSETKGANKRSADDDTGDSPMNVKRRCLRLLEQSAHS